MDETRFAGSVIRALTVLSPRGLFSSCGTGLQLHSRTLRFNCFLTSCSRRSGLRV